MRENCKSSLLVARSISCRRRSHANCCIKVKNLQLQHQLHSHKRTHAHTDTHINASRRCRSAAQVVNGNGTWACTLAHTLTLTHTWISCCLSCLTLFSSSSPPPLVSSIMPKCSYLRNERRIALHRIACPFFVLRLTFACWLTGYGYGYAFERFKFHIATALPPLLPFPRPSRISATLSELNNLSQVFLSKMATCNYVDTPSTHCNHKFIKKHTHTHAHRKIPSYFGLSSTSFRPDFICFPLGHLKVKIVFCALLKVNPFCNMFLVLWP